MPVLHPQALIDNRIKALQEAHLAAKCPRAELDLSGGIDSAVMAVLLVRALGAENVTLAHTRMSTSSEQTQRAKDLAKALGCPMINGYFGPSYDLIMEELFRSLMVAGYDMNEIRARMDKDPTIEGSIRSTLRAPLGRAYNRLTGGGLRHGTGNECEDRFLRFYQKGGDGEVDSNPLAMLSKGEVYQMAVALDKDLDYDPCVGGALVPIIKATPSPDLWGSGDNHSDEAELLTWTGAPFTYSRVDPQTGEYSSVGTIERVSRLLDTPSETYWEGLLFNSVDPSTGRLRPSYFDGLVPPALDTQAFRGFSKGPLRTLLEGAAMAEFQTRHKENPNIPTYGSRKSLLRDGILTDELPTL